MSPTIAVLGHRGWLGQSVVPKLVDAGLKTKVIVREGSTVGDLPQGVEAVSLNWSDSAAFIKALEDVDVVM
jgi:nucleoside-diphosphate-sugar epimerase